MGHPRLQLAVARQRPGAGMKGSATAETRQRHGRRCQQRQDGRVERPLQNNWARWSNNQQECGVEVCYNERRGQMECWCWG